MWHRVPFARQRRPIIGVLRMCWILPGSFDCPHASVRRPSIACLAVFLCGPGALFLHALSGPSTICPSPPPPPQVVLGCQKEPRCRFGRSIPGWSGWLPTFREGVAQRSGPRGTTLGPPAGGGGVVLVLRSRVRVRHPGLGGWGGAVQCPRGSSAMSLCDLLIGGGRFWGAARGSGGGGGGCRHRPLGRPIPRRRFTNHVSCR